MSGHMELDEYIARLCSILALPDAVQDEALFGLIDHFNRFQHKDGEPGWADRDVQHASNILYWGLQEGEPIGGGLLDHQKLFGAESASDVVDLFNRLKELL